MTDRPTSGEDATAPAANVDTGPVDIPVVVVSPPDADVSSTASDEEAAPDAATEARSAIAAVIEAANRMGIEMDAVEAAEWLAAMARDPGGPEIVVDETHGVFGHRITMLDFHPEELARFREIGRLVSFADRPGVHTALALSGSAAQSKIQRYPGDCDFFERVHIEAATRDEACAVLADLIRDKALESAGGPAHRLLEVKFGSYPRALVRAGKDRKPGSPISWTLEEIRAGRIEATEPNGTPASIDWDEVAADPGWCKLDWIVTDPVRRSLSNASNMIDATWEAPDGSITPLDGFIDPYFQEVYLDAESLPVFTKLVQQVTPDALDRYLDELEAEVRKYLTQEQNYGKAARRLYNIFRLTGRYEDAAYIRELFDEPSTVLYRVWALVRSLEEAAATPSADQDILVEQVDELIMAAVRVLEGDREALIVSHLLRLRDSLGRGTSATRASDVEAARDAAMEAVNTYFLARLMALPSIEAYLSTVTRGVEMPEPGPLV